MKYYYIYFGRLIIYLKKNWLQIILIILSLYELRIEIRLLFDFFTFSTLFHTIYEHPLAITVLTTIPRFFYPIKNNN